MICREIRLSLKKKAFCGQDSAKVYVAPVGTSVTNVLFRRRNSSTNQLFMQKPSANIPENKDITAVQPDIFYKVDIVVIGAGQAGLSAAYYIKKLGEDAGLAFVVLGGEFGAGGAWQRRCDSLTLSNVNGINDLPGMGFAEAVNLNDNDLQANTAIPKYYEKYEQAFELPIIRPIRVLEVNESRGSLVIRTNGVQFNARGIIIT